uniref:Uncharacterized protein n=1 Tax=Anguilla anguilla TaxID=7936 RepID=A0A0E9P6S4_ANGAN
MTALDEDFKKEVPKG